jgi:ABC-type sugar transport system ATPase subunit
MIELKNIVKSFNDKTILDGASISIGKGEVVVLHGKNGSGKTTLLRIVAGFEKEDSGVVTLSDNNIKCLLCHQKPYLFFGTVQNNISLGMKLTETSREIVKRLQIEHLLKVEAKELSAGQMQIVAFARAVAASPDVLLLDEPTSNVDSTFSALIEEEIEECRKKGAAIVVVTHSVKFMEKNEYRQLKLENGKILQQSNFKNEELLVNKIKNSAIVDINGRCRLTCELAHDIAKTFNVSLNEIGIVCNREGIKISSCQIGVFK